MQTRHQINITPKGESKYHPVLHLPSSLHLPPTTISTPSRLRQRQPRTPRIKPKVRHRRILAIPHDLQRELPPIRHRKRPQLNQLHSSRSPLHLKSRQMSIPLIIRPRLIDPSLEF